MGESVSLIPVMLLTHHITVTLLHHTYHIRTYIFCAFACVAALLILICSTAGTSASTPVLVTHPYMQHRSLCLLRSV